MIPPAVASATRSERPTPGFGQRRQRGRKSLVTSEIVKVSEIGLQWWHIQQLDCCGLLDVRYAPIATKFRSAAK
jgi:hypothetical protein